MPMVNEIPRKSENPVRQKIRRGNFQLSCGKVQHNLNMRLQMYNFIYIRVLCNTGHEGKNATRGAHILVSFMQVGSLRGIVAMSSL